MINSAITTAVLASAKRDEFREKVEGRLKKARALGSASAIELEVKDDAERMLIDEALASGVIIRTGNGRLYLNERARAERQEGQAHLVVMILLVVASLMASLAALLATRN